MTQLLASAFLALAALVAGVLLASPTSWE